MGDKEYKGYKEILKKQLFESEKTLNKLRKKRSAKELEKSVTAPYRYAKKTYKAFKKDLFPTVSYADVLSLFSSSPYGARSSQVESGNITPAAKLNKAVLSAGKKALAGILWAVANAPEAAYDYVFKPAAAAVGGIGGRLYEDIKSIPTDIKHTIQDIDLAVSSPQAKKLINALFRPRETVKPKEYKNYLEKVNNVIQDYKMN